MTSAQRHSNNAPASPAPKAIRASRESLGLSQTAAAAVVYSTLRTWQDWEAGVAKMHPGLFELFKLKTGSDEE
jgi:putative transcriptional regulator